MTNHYSEHHSCWRKGSNHQETSKLDCLTTRFLLAIYNYYPWNYHLLRYTWSLSLRYTAFTMFALVVPHESFQIYLRIFSFLIKPEIVVGIFIDVSLHVFPGDLRLLFHLCTEYQTYVYREYSRYTIVMNCMGEPNNISYEIYKTWPWRSYTSKKSCVILVMQTMFITHIFM